MAYKKVLTAAGRKNKAQNKGHTQMQSIKYNCEIAAREMDKILDDILSNDFYKREPTKIMDVIVDMIYDKYSDLCRELRVNRYNTINGNAWSNHDAPIAHFILCHTSYRERVAPLVIKHSKKFLAFLGDRYKPHYYIQTLKDNPKQTIQTTLL